MTNFLAAHLHHERCLQKPFLVSDLWRERRAKARLSGNFPALVRGTNAKGEEFVEHGWIENLSASGLYLQLPRAVAADASLLIIFRCSPPQQPGPHFAARGVVRHQMSLPEKGWTGVGMQFRQQRFLGNTLLYGNTLFDCDHPVALLNGHAAVKPEDGGAS